MTADDTMLLDKILLKSGCLDKSPRLQVINQVCRIAVRPHDETAKVIEGSATTMIDALESAPNSKTLLLHGFKETIETEGNPSESAESVRQLCLSDCSFDCLQSLPSVEVLILWKCSFRDIEKMPNLKALVLVDTFVRPEVLAGLLKDAQSLQRLALIRAGDIACLGKDKGFSLSPTTKPLLFHTRTIREIVLRGTLLPRQDLVHNIQANPLFTKLSISQAWLPDPLVAWMAHAMGTPGCALKDFSIKEVQWSPRASLHLVDGLYHNSGIERLDISNTLWHSYPRVALCHYLEHHAKSVKEIRLESMVDPSMISHVIDACARNDSLNALALARNFLDFPAMCSLAKLLKQHPSLVNINLSHCIPEDATHWGHTVMTGLATNTSLKSLSLDGCQIGDLGASVIGRALATNTVLSRVDLCHNGIGTDGTSELVNGLKTNQALEQIFLHGNKSEEECAILLRDMMKNNNKNLRVVFLPESSLQEELQYYGALNFAGRKYVADPTIPHSLWPAILERAASISPDITFALLRQKPDLLIQCNAPKKRCIEEVSNESGAVDTQPCSRRKLGA